MNLSVVDKWKCSMFTDNGGTPKSSMFMAFSIQNHPAIGSKKTHGNPETWASGRTRRRCGPPAVHDPSLPGLTFQGFHEKTDPQFIGSWVVR